MRFRRPLASGLALLGLCSAVNSSAAAQDDPTAAIDPALIDGPPAPVPPAVMTSDEQGAGDGARGPLRRGD